MAKKSSPKFSKKVEVDISKIRNKALITMQASKIRNSNYKLVKIGDKVENFARNCGEQNSLLDTFCPTYN